MPGASGVLTGVSLDSRRIRPGDLYVGLPGAATHGARFAAVAVAAGAIAVLTDAAGGALAADAGVPVAIVEDPRVAMARIAADVYGRPAERTHLFGVTGTNGKTSTVFLLDAALTAVGLRVATIGTIGFRLGGAPLDAPRSTITTPEAPDLQALLSVMVEGGADAVTMEVSSHALALHRVDGMVFDVAAFTMLGHDHLEFHHTLEAYFEAKARLFTGGRCRVAVINTADPWGRTLADRVRSEGVSDLVTTLGPDADYRVLHAEPRPSGGSRVVLAHPGGELDFTTSMLGDFNVANAVTALAMVGARGGDLALAASGLAEAHVPGRMQRVDLGAEAPHVVVDFAHTPQAVQAALAALPATGRHLAVLGAGEIATPPSGGRWDALPPRARTWWWSPTTIRVARTLRRSGPRCSPGPVRFPASRSLTAAIADRRSPRRCDAAVPVTGSPSWARDTSLARRSQASSPPSTMSRWFAT